MLLSRRLTKALSSAKPIQFACTKRFFSADVEKSSEEVKEGAS